MRMKNGTTGRTKGAGYAQGEELTFEVAGLLSATCWDSSDMGFQKRGGTGAPPRE